ncbi:Rickettsia 17 kDa surface antigen [Collimonas fungivorans Ter331]|uniref:Rickettsia 17 kDa surface antigen n=2 Tax=Collimonas fungivorans TaxID=158899 RepID=G0AAK0_COLFT|nr:Rickettsia 17 kDa surface antigen [Collimonas fungivorans Ter331]
MPNCKFRNNLALPRRASQPSRSLHRFSVVNRTYASHSKYYTEYTNQHNEAAMTIRKTTQQAMLAAVIGGALLLGGCAAPYGGQGYGNQGYNNQNYGNQGYGNPQPQSYPGYQQGGYQQNRENNYGVVDAIDVVNTPSQGIGGAVVGGVLGGVVGHQVGHGTGNTLATIAGVVGGAVAGNQLEARNSPGSTSYNVRVRMNNNGYQTISVGNPGDLRVGDRVRVENGQISRY